MQFNPDENPYPDKPAMPIRVVSAIVVVFFILLAIGFDKIGSFIDIPSLQIVVVCTIAALFASNKFEHIQDLPLIIKGKLIPQNEKELRPYIRITELGSRYAIGMGAVGTLLGIILMLGNMSDVDSIGPNMAVSLITALYGILLSELFFMPLKGHILSLYYDNQKQEVQENASTIEESVNKVQSEKESKFGAILLVVIIPMFALFILLLSMSEIPKDKSIWSDHNCKQLKIENFVLKDSSDPSLNPITLPNDSIDLEGISDYIFFPKDPKSKIPTRVFINAVNSLNKNQIKLHFDISSIEYKTDTFCYEKEFSYHITKDKVNHMLIEYDDVSIEFDITLQSIEKPTTAPSVSSTLSPIDEE